MSVRIKDLPSGSPSDNSYLAFDEEAGTKKVKMSDLLSGKVDKTNILSTTLTVAGWSNKSQTISNVYFVASGYAYFVSPSPSNAKEYAEAFVIASDVTTDGSMTFSCENVPTTDLAVEIWKVGVSA